MSQNIKPLRRNRRPKGWTQPHWWLPAKDFREVIQWLDDAVLNDVLWHGGDGVEASDFVIRFNGRGDAPPGWDQLSDDRQQKQVWHSIDRLCKKRLIERYYSKRRDHNRSRVRLREVNVLDRLVHELEKSDG